MCQQRKIKAKSQAVSFNNLRDKQLYLDIRSVQQNERALNSDGALFFLNANATLRSMLRSTSFTQWCKSSRLRRTSLTIKP